MKADVRRCCIRVEVVDSDCTFEDRLKEASKDEDLDKNHTMHIPT